MIQSRSQPRTNGPDQWDGQPIAFAVGALLAILLAIGAIALWRGSSGDTPESDRVVAARQIQARTAQASEQLVEKTTGLEATQQQSIDQLQVVQDQLHGVRSLLAAQQADTKRLSQEVADLSAAIDGLRQSFASVQSAEADPPGKHAKPIRSRSHASRRLSPPARPTS
jgi:uncharacterized protein HemX